MFGLQNTKLATAVKRQYTIWMMGIARYRKETNYGNFKTWVIGNEDFLSLIRKENAYFFSSVRDFS